VEISMNGDHVHLPSPSIWPLTVGGGASLAGFGLLTSYALSALGVALMIWGIYNWIQELRHD
jgi:hypothetical protein